MSEKLTLSFYQNVENLLKQAKANVKTTINLTMVYTYYEIGKMIVEEEQKGKNRADYGTYLLSGLSEYLTKKFG